MVKLLSKPHRDLSTDYVSSENLVSSSNFLAEVTEFSEKIQLFLKAVSKWGDLDGDLCSKVLLFKENASFELKFAKIKVWLQQSRSQKFLNWTVELYTGIKEQWKPDFWFLLSLCVKINTNFWAAKETYDYQHICFFFCLKITYITTNLWVLMC